MNVVYTSQHGCFAALTCSMIHLRRWPRSSPGWRAMLGDPAFEKICQSPAGQPLELGKDTAGHRILVLADGGKPQVIDLAAQDLLAKLGVDSEWFFTGTAGILPPVPLMDLLGKPNQAWYCNWMARRVHRHYGALVSLVERVQGQLAAVDQTA